MKGLIIAAVVVGGTLIALFVWSDMNDLSNKKKGVPVDDSWSVIKSEKLDNGLEIKEVKIGEGPAAKPGDTLVVHYTGTLKDGTVFDTSKAKGRKPFDFQLGAGGVIEGWDLGMVGMKVGGIRILVVPPELGYRDRAMEKIPPNSELTFKVELLQIVK